MKELDLLSRLEECRRDDSNPTVDCTLKLGLPSNPVPEFPVADKKPRIDFPMIYGAPQVYVIVHLSDRILSSLTSSC